VCHAYVRVCVCVCVRVCNEVVAHVLTFIIPLSLLCVCVCVSSLCIVVIEDAFMHPLFPWLVWLTISVSKGMPCTYAHANTRYGVFASV
jgi:hypothetical protein